MSNCVACGIYLPEWEGIVCKRCSGVVKSYYDAKLNNDCENCQRCHLICEEDNICYKEENNEKNTI